MNQDAQNGLPDKKKAPFFFYLILGIIPILFFVVLEIALRFSDYGYDYTVFKESEEGVPGVLYVNPNISYKYFGNLTSSVFSSEIGFYKQKPENSFRVFVLGGSSTQGFPYNQQASFPAHLKRRLELFYPSQLIEVVNLGASAINSYTLRDILPDVLEQSPDLILIYAGHNEYYGALGAGSTRATNPAFGNFLLFLREYRTVQLLENIIAGVAHSGNGREDENLMQTMIGESLIAYESEIYQKGIEQFDKNLTAIIKKIKDAGVPLVIGTLSSNLNDQQPFNSDQVSQEGRSANDYFRLGKELFVSANYQKAKEAFVMAKEYDGLRFRAPERINQIISDKAKKYQVPVAPIEKVFSQRSPGNITGANLMCDHLHPNLEGLFLMAKVFSETILSNEILPKPHSSIANMLLDSLVLANFPYSAFDTIVDNHILYSGIGQYPFVAPGQPNPYQDILDQDGVNFNTSSINEKDSIRSIIASNHLKKGDTNAFINEMRVFLSYFPYNEVRYLRAINLLSKGAALQNGYPLLLNSLKALKQSNAKNKALGTYHKYMQQYDSALFYLEKALETNPTDNLVLLDIGFIHLDLEHYEKAEATFTKVIANSPDNQEAYHQRSVARFELKNYAGTIEDISNSLKLKDKPDTLSYLIRGFAQFGINDRKSACDDWRLAAQLGSRQGQLLIQSYCN